MPFGVIRRDHDFSAGMCLLILDELGYVPATKTGAELLFDVIVMTHERLSVIITTNLPFENWTEVLGSERLTGAALDRLAHRCHILETRGDSDHMQQAHRRRKLHFHTAANTDPWIRSGYGWNSR